MPTPVTEPFAKATKPWIIWKPLPIGSLQGSQNASKRLILYGAIKIKTTTINTAKITPINGNFHPRRSICMTKHIAVTKIVPPKFGWNIKGTAKIKIVVKVGLKNEWKSPRDKLTSSSFNLLAMKIGKANKTNSRGWNLKPGNANQRLAPPTLTPIPGIKVKSNKIHENKNNFALCFLNFSVETNMQTNIKVTPSPINWNWRSGWANGLPAVILLRSDNDEIIIIPQPLSINGIITSRININF